MILFLCLTCKEFKIEVVGHHIPEEAPFFAQKRREIGTNSVDYVKMRFFIDF
jgi:hypothetical protein